MYLALFEERLCKEHPKAWKYGPAFPSAFSAHHKNKIEFDNLSIESLESECLSVLNETIKYFGKYSAQDLIKWTHKKNGPWAVCSDNGKVLYNEINDSVIQVYFKPHVLSSSDE